MSAIHIAPMRCPLSIQRLRKNVKFTTSNQRLLKLHKRRRYKGYLSVLWPLLYFSTLATSAHAIPGTNHVLVKGDTSSDKTREQNYVNAIFESLDDNRSSGTISKSTPATTETTSTPTVGSVLKKAAITDIRTEPYCFLADIDSVSYVLDTGANRIIVNDARLLHDLRPTSDKIKGVGGRCVRIAGTGRLILPLKTSNNKLNLVSDLHAVYVPSCPYNLIPPQILCKQMRLQNYTVEHFKHDDKEYIFNFLPPSSTKMCTLTVPIGNNNLFTMKTNEGYTNFMSRAPKYLPDFNNFTDAGVHTIPNDSDSFNPSSPSSITLPSLRPT